LPAASVRKYEKSTVPPAVRSIEPGAFTLTKPLNVSEKRYSSPRVKGKVKLASPGRARRSPVHPLAEHEAVYDPTFTCATWPVGGPGENGSSLVNVMNPDRKGPGVSSNSDAVSLNDACAVAAPIVSPFARPVKDKDVPEKVPEMDATAVPKAGGIVPFMTPVLPRLS
jgi:hypothetical protein